MFPWALVPCRSLWFFLNVSHEGTPSVVLFLISFSARVRRSGMCLRRRVVGMEDGAVEERASRWCLCSLPVLHARFQQIIAGVICLYFSFGVSTSRTTSPHILSSTPTRPVLNRNGETWGQKGARMSAEEVDFLRLGDVYRWLVAGYTCGQPSC